jgi:hypothetical protein
VVIDGGFAFWRRGAAFSIWCKNGVQQGLRRNQRLEQFGGIFSEWRAQILSALEQANEEQALNNPSGLSFIHATDYSLLQTNNNSLICSDRGGHIYRQ